MFYFVYIIITFYALGVSLQLAEGYPSISQCSSRTWGSGEHHVSEDCRFVFDEYVGGVTIDNGDVSEILGNGLSKPSIDAEDHYSPNRVMFSVLKGTLRIENVALKNAFADREGAIITVGQNGVAMLKHCDIVNGKSYDARFYLKPLFNA